MKVCLGEPEIGIEQPAIRLSPLGPDALLSLIGKAYAYFMGDRYSEAWSTAVVATQRRQRAEAYRIAAASSPSSGTEMKRLSIGPVPEV